MTTDHPHECDFCHATAARWLFGDYMLCDACIDDVAVEMSAAIENEDETDGTT